MYKISLHKALQTRRFTIELRPTGWEVVHERDNSILRRVVYHDWHRVERALADFKRQEAELEAGGWVKTAS